MRLALIGVMLATSCGKAGPSEADRAAINAVMLKTKQSVEVNAAARNKGLRAAFAASPVSSDRPCDQPLPPGDALLAYKPGGPGGARAHEAKTHFTIAPAWALLDQPPPRERSELEDKWARRPNGTPYAMVEQDLKFVTDDVAAGKLTLEEVQQRATDVASGPGWGWELIAVAQQTRPPARAGEGTFTPGRIVGRAFLWSFADRRVVCEGTFEASNSDEVSTMHVSARTRALLGNDKHEMALDRNLEDETFRAAVASLRRAQ
jgi:hypothetical protein